MSIETLLEEKTEEIHRRRSIRTVARHKDEWLANAMANAPIAKKDLSLLWLDRGYGEIVAVAAGPSLDADLDRLRSDVRGREIIVVDAALKYCIDNGLIPDYVICSDGSDKVIQMIDGIQGIPTRLILNVIANPGVAAAWKGGEIYWFISANNILDADLGRTIQDLHGIATHIGTKIMPGGNVSSVMLGFCLSIRNANKVLLYGHDFCWKTGMYCGGHHRELEKERMDDERRSGTIFETVNTGGGKVLSNLSLKQYAAWHEQVISRFGDRVENRTSSTILKLPSQGGTKYGAHLGIA